MKSEIKFNEKGLVPAVVQDVDTGEVLMLGYMNQEALSRTLTTGDVWFYSRSRQELWHKGETSGNFIHTVEVWKDCDNDTILVKAKPVGPVCHTGNRTCFFQKLSKDDIK
jgi:phosphoribosyl-AMP cyclohydrolase